MQQQRRWKKPFLKLWQNPGLPLQEQIQADPGSLKSQSMESDVADLSSLARLRHEYEPIAENNRLFHDIH